MVLPINQRPRRSPYTLSTQGMTLPPMPSLDMNGFPQVAPVAPLPPMQMIQPPPPPQPFRSPVPPPMPENGINLGNLISQAQAQGNQGRQAFMPFAAQAAAEQMGLVPSYQQKLADAAKADAARSAADRQASLADYQTRLQMQNDSDIALKKAYKDQGLTMTKLEPIEIYKQTLDSLAITNPEMDASSRQEIAMHRAYPGVKWKGPSPEDVADKKWADTRALMVKAHPDFSDEEIDHVTQQAIHQTAAQKVAAASDASWEKGKADWLKLNPGKTDLDATAYLISEAQATAQKRTQNQEQYDNDLLKRVQNAVLYYGADPAKDNWTPARHLMTLANMTPAAQNEAIGKAVQLDPAQQWGSIQTTVALNFQAGQQAAMQNPPSGSAATAATLSVSPSISMTTSTAAPSVAASGAATPAKVFPPATSQDLAKLQQDTLTGGESSFPTVSSEDDQLLFAPSTGKAAPVDISRELQQPIIGPSNTTGGKVSNAPMPDQMAPHGDPMLEGAGGLGAGPTPDDLAALQQSTLTGDEGGIPTMPKPATQPGGIELPSLLSTAEAQGLDEPAPAQNAGLFGGKSIAQLIGDAVAGGGSGQVAGTGIAALAGARKGAGLVGLGTGLVGAGLGLYGDTTLPGAGLAKRATEVGPIGWMSDIFNLINSVVEPPWEAATHKDYFIKIPGLGKSLVELAQNPQEWDAFWHSPQGIALQGTYFNPAINPLSAVPISMERERIAELAKATPPQLSANPLQMGSELYRFGNEIPEHDQPGHNLATSITNPAWLPVGKGLEVLTEGLGVVPRLARNPEARQALIEAVNKPGDVATRARNILSAAVDQTPHRLEVQQAVTQMARELEDGILPQSATAEALNGLKFVGGAFARSDRSTKLMKRVERDVTTDRLEGHVEEAKYTADNNMVSADPNFTVDQMKNDLRDHQVEHGLQIEDVTVSPEEIAKRRAEMEAHNDIPDVQTPTDVEDVLDGLKNATVETDRYGRARMIDAAADAKKAGYGNRGPVWEAARAQAQLDAIELAKTLGAAFGILKDKAEARGIWRPEDTTKVQVIQRLMAEKGKTWEADRAQFAAIQRQATIEGWSPQEFIEAYHDARDPLWKSHDDVATAFEAEYAQAVTTPRPIQRGVPDKTRSVLQGKGYDDAAIDAMTADERQTALSGEPGAVTPKGMPAEGVAPEAQAAGGEPPTETALPPAETPKVEPSVVSSEPQPIDTITAPTQADMPPIDLNAPISEQRTQAFQNVRRLAQSAQKLGITVDDAGMAADLNKELAGISTTLPAAEQEAARAAAMERFATTQRQELSGAIDSEIASSQGQPKPDAAKIAKLQGLRAITDFQGAQDFLGYLQKHWAPKTIPKNERAAALTDFSTAVADMLAGKEPTITENIKAVITEPINRGGAGIPSTRRGGRDISAYDAWAKDRSGAEILSHALVTMTAQTSDGMRAVLGVKPVAAATTARIAGTLRNRLSAIEKEIGGLSGQLTTAVKPLTKLPENLKGATPNYRSFQTKFASDIDRALYIVAQTKPSKNDAGYMAFLKKALPGLSDADLRARGRDVRKVIGDIASTASEGDVLQIPATEHGRLPQVERGQVPIQKIADLQAERDALNFLQGITRQSTKITDLAPFRDALTQLNVDLRPYVGKNGASKITEVSGEAVAHLVDVANSEGGGAKIGEAIGDPEAGQAIAQVIKENPTVATGDRNAIKATTDSVMSYLRQRVANQLTGAQPSPTGTDATRLQNPYGRTVAKVYELVNNAFMWSIFSQPSMLVHVAEGTAEMMAAQGVGQGIFVPGRGGQIKTEIEALSKAVLPKPAMERTGIAGAMGKDVRRDAAGHEARARILPSRLGGLPEAIAQRASDAINIVPNAVHQIEYRGKLATWDHFFNKYFDLATNELAPSLKDKLTAMTAREAGVGPEAAALIERYLPRAAGPKSLDAIFDHATLNKASSTAKSAAELDAIDRWKTRARDTYLSFDQTERQAYLTLQDVANRATLNRIDTMFINRMDTTRLEGFMRQLFPFYNYDSQMPALMTRAFFKQPVLGNAYFAYYREANREANQPDFPQRARGGLLANVALPGVGGGDTSIRVTSGTLGGKYGQSLLPPTQRQQANESPGQSALDAVSNYFTPGLATEAAVGLGQKFFGGAQQAQTFSPITQEVRGLAMGAGGDLDLENAVVPIREIIYGTKTDPFVLSEANRRLASIMADKNKSVKEATAEDNLQARKEAGMALFWNAITGSRLKSITGGEQRRLDVLAESLGIPAAQATQERTWEEWRKLDNLKKSDIYRQNPWLDGFWQVSEPFLPPAEREQRQALRNFSNEWGALHQVQTTRQIGVSDQNDPHYGYYQDDKGAWQPSIDYAFAENVKKQGFIEAAAAWRKAHHDLLTQMQGAKDEITGRYKDTLAKQDLERIKSPKDQLFEQYLAINPDDFIPSEQEKIDNPGSSALTGGVDWEAYYAARQRFLAKQKPEDQQYIRDMQTKNVSSPVEMTYYQALQNLDQLRTIPQYLDRATGRPITLAEDQRIRNARAVVARVQAMERNHEDVKRSSKQVAVDYGVANLNTRPLNPAYTQYLDAMRNTPGDPVAWGLVNYPTQQAPSMSMGSGLSMSTSNLKKPPIQENPMTYGLAPNGQLQGPLQGPPMPVMGR